MRRPNKKEFEIAKVIVAFCSISLLLFSANIMIGYSQPQSPPPSGGQQQPQQPPPMQGQQQAQKQQMLQQLQQQQDQIQQQIQQLQQRQDQIGQMLNPLQLEPDVQLQLQQQQAQKQLTPQEQQQLQQVQQQAQQQAQQLTPQQQQQGQLQLQQMEQQVQALLQKIDQLKLQQMQVQQPPLSQPPAQQQVPPNQQPQQLQEIPVTVRFDSITVINDHDPETTARKVYAFVTKGTTQDGGDWILDAFVNGQNVHLSANKLLDEVYSGKTYKFPASAQVTVNIPRNGNLPINIIGTDIDKCDISDNVISGILSAANQQFGGFELGQRIEKALTPKGGQSPATPTPQSNLQSFATINQAFDTISSAYGTSATMPAAPGPAAALIVGPKIHDYVKSTFGNLIRNVLCKSDPNDILGDVNEYYPGPNFGTSPPGSPTTKSVKSVIGDYVIRYTIISGR